MKQNYLFTWDFQSGIVLSGAVITLTFNPEMLN